MRNDTLKKALFTFLALLVITELVSRYYGFNNYPLFEESKEFEYIHRPNQDVRIYQNHFITNEYSMRSGPVSKDDTLVVLLIGDSVINGGNQVDHNDLASTLLENRLSKELNKKVRVLNISSYTWGPDNVYAYLKKYGTFSADLIVMVNNSGDAFDNMTFEKRVGVKPNFPEKNYALACLGLFDRGWSMIAGKFKKRVPEERSVRSKEFDPGFENINSLATRLNVPLLVYLHATTQEMDEKKYSAEGQLILDFFAKKNRKVIKELDLPLDKNFYVDEIHFNAKGQHFMSDNLYNPIYNLIKN
ncbi:hypothetical protein [Larkinella arboricola]